MRTPNDSVPLKKSIDGLRRRISLNHPCQKTELGATSYAFTKLREVGGFPVDLGKPLILLMFR